MLQRIQSLFLFVVLGISVADLFMPLAVYQNTEKHYQLMPLNAIDVRTGSAMDSPQSFPLFIIMAVVVIVTAVIIFSYKNRPAQMKLCKLNMLLNIVFVVMVFWYADILEKETSINSQYAMGAWLPLISLVLLFLTNRSIKKDEELVKSTDRLR